MTEALHSVIMEELHKLPAERGLIFKNNSAWIRCPYHGNGQERTPSLKINLDDESTVPIGAWNCFACDEGKGVWPKLAEKLGLKGADPADVYESTVQLALADHDRKTLLGDKAPVLPRGAMPWPEKYPWRNISGLVFHKIGGLLYYDDVARVQRAFIPVRVLGDTVGGVRCNINPSKYGSNYYNTSGPWSRDKGLLGYDYVAEHMDCSIIALVEGARDSLNLVQHGFPALAILGSAKAWSRSKANLILNLEPKLVLLAFDNDPAGRIAANNAARSLKDHVIIKRFVFPVADKQSKMDASDLSEQQVKALYRKLQTEINKH